MSEFDRCSWLVKWTYGQRYRCYRMPAADRVTIWRWPGGVTVAHPSLSAGLKIADDIRRRDLQ